MSTSRVAMPRASRLAVAVLAALAVSLSTVVSATEAGDAVAAGLGADVTAHTLDAVVVTAQPVSPLTFETDPKIPRQPVPASDGADYLKTIPGFSAVRNGGTNGDPVLRGMFGSRLNLLTNDGAMPGACPSRMDNPMSYVSPETYDRLVVTKGPQTVLWGPGASAGTVRFERERERFESPGLKLAGSLLGGSFGRNDQVLDATAGAPLGYARLSANRSDSDDYEDGDGRVVASAWNKWNTDVALGWTPNADTSLELSAGFGDGEARYAARSMDGSMFERESYALRFRQQYLEGGLDEIEASVFLNHANHVMDNYTLRQPNPNGPMPMPMASNVDRLTSGGRMAASWGMERVDLTAGLDAQRSRHRQRKAMGRDAYLSRPWLTDARFENAGVFAEATWRVLDRTRLIAGARADRAAVTDERATAGMGAMPNPTAGVTRRETLGAGFVRYEQDAAVRPLTWYAGIGHTERMPDYWELFSASTGPVGSSNAFAGVTTEKTTQLDLGLQYKASNHSAWISLYAGRIDDYLLFVYRPGGMSGWTSSVSGIDAEIRGGELGIELRPAPHWKIGGSVAHAWGANRDRHAALPQMPPLDVRLSLARDNGRWSFGALARGVAAQERVSVGQGNVVGRDIGPSAGFATFAINGGYRFSERTLLTAGIDNLFDRAFSEHLNLAGVADFGYPADPLRINEPGRTGWLKLNMKY